MSSVTTPARMFSLSKQAVEQFIFMPPAGSMLLLSIYGVAIVPHFFLLVPIDSIVCKHVAFGDQGLFLKKPSLDPAKTFD